MISTRHLVLPVPKGPKINSGRFPWCLLKADCTAVVCSEFRNGSKSLRGAGCFVIGGGGSFGHRRCLEFLNKLPKYIGSA